VLDQLRLDPRDELVGREGVQFDPGVDQKLDLCRGGAVLPESRSDLGGYLLAVVQNPFARTDMVHGLGFHPVLEHVLEPQAEVDRAAAEPSVAIGVPTKGASDREAGDIEVPDGENGRAVFH